MCGLQKHRTKPLGTAFAAMHIRKSERASLQVTICVKHFAKRTPKDA